ncbi:MAG: ATP-binding protein [Rhodoferax sp.]
MRRLFLQLYGAILAVLLLAMLAAQQWNLSLYAAEVEAEYLQTATLYTQAIQRELAHGADEAAVLAWWQRQLRDSAEIDMVPVARPAQLERATVRALAITEAEDQLEILVPFDAQRALRFGVNDRSGLETRLAYYGGHALIYLSLAVLLFALTRMLVRQIDRIRRQAQRIADGDYGADSEAPSVAAFTGLHDDLRRMALALAEKTQENHLLTAAIPHELRTPLTRLRLALDMALTTTRTHEVPELLQDMDGALTELSRVLDDLLTLSRLRLAQQALPQQAVALDEVLRACAARQGDERIQLQLQPCRVRAHPPLLERALGNVIENACKHARQCITVSLRQEAGAVVLEVSDDGPGIAAPARARVHEPFFRAEGEHRRSAGWGLGLAITDLAMRHSGAQWSVDASASGGACLRFVWQPPGPGTP